MEQINYLDSLKEKAKATGSILCMGIDPVLEDIPLRADKEHAITQFYFDILDALDDESKIPSIKPNIAFFEQYGFEGLRALKKIIEHSRSKKIDVILDAKRGDIGKTSSAYAKSAFSFWNADAITVNPYMGSDSVLPFVEYCKEGKGVYVLVKTSNKGSSDLQDLKIKNGPLYMRTAEKVADWHTPGVGAVVGATYPKELKNILSFFSASKKEVPLLIPGVGSQGGDAEETMKLLRETGDISIHRINSSSGINYAYKKEGTTDYAGAAVREIKRLNKVFKV